MSISSPIFAAFVLIALAVYYLLRRPAQNRWLLAASVVFYGSWAPGLVVLLFVMGGGQLRAGAVDRGAREARAVPA